eukprot:scaffold4477_cov265-Pinguiococcus_pyrenoidosus.AAC.2
MGSSPCPSFGWAFGCSRLAASPGILHRTSGHQSPLLQQSPRPLPTPYTRATLPSIPDCEALPLTCTSQLVGRQRRVFACFKLSDVRSSRPMTRQCACSLLDCMISNKD